MSTILTGYFFQKVPEGGNSVDLKTNFKSMLGGTVSQEWTYTNPKRGLAESLLSMFFSYIQISLKLDLWGNHCIQNVVWEQRILISHRN